MYNFIGIGNISSDTMHSYNGHSHTFHRTVCQSDVFLLDINLVAVKRTLPYLFKYYKELK